MLVGIGLKIAELYTIQFGGIFVESSFVEMDLITNTQEFFSKED